jgi:anti-sigma B factor antagonist
VTEAGNNESLTVEIVDGVLVVHGDIDIAAGPILDAALMSLEATGSIVIDLGDVYFIDSSGLRSLLAASRAARARDATVVLRSLGPEVARLLQLTGTIDQFAIESLRA